MLARILDNHYVYLEQVHGNEETLIDWFSARDPKAHFLSGPWDGWYRKYNTVKQRLALPFLKELEICCQVKNIPFQIIDERPAPKFPAPQEDQITETFLDSVTLEPYQVRSLKATCNEEIGIISSTTGSGKTEVMCGIVKLFRCPTVVITEQIVVLEQIVERLQMRQVVHNDDIGMFCHGNMPDGNLVIVGSIQSLSTPPVPKKEDIKQTTKKVMAQGHKWAEERSDNLLKVFPTALAEALYDNPDGIYDLQGRYYDFLRDFYVDIEFQKYLKAYKTRLVRCREIQDFVHKCDLLLVDEADLATTKQYSALFRKHFIGRRRFGFSGTPFDKKKPINNLILKENLGCIISHTTRDEVQTAGRIIPVKFYMIGIGMDGNRDDSRAYDIALKEEIVDNNEFHSLVAQIAQSFPNDGTLILVDTSPIEPLGIALENLIDNSKFIFGTTSKKVRREQIEMFERRELKCLIGSKILKRGLDLEGGCENLIIIGGGGSWSDFDQKVGRAVRKNKKGSARVFAFFFLNNKYLYKHSRENLKAAVDMGYNTTVIIGDAEIDGSSFVKSRFRIPKPK